MRANSTRRTFLPLVFCPIPAPVTNLWSPPFPPITHHPLPAPRQLRNPSHTYRHVHPPLSAALSLHSRTGSPHSTQCMLRDSRRSRHLPCTRASTVRRSGASGMRTLRCVRVCTTPSRGMRRRRHCWEQSAHSGALRRCGRYSGLMRKMGNQARRENNSPWGC